nr:glucose PTS transporter subunit EIIB [Streptococcus equi]
MIPTVVTAFMAGITEPLEFLFLFLSPVLWLAHAIVYGLSLLITNLIGISIQFDTGINMIINSFAFPLSLGKQYWIPVVFVITAVIEYLVFRYLIVKLNIPTLGREDMADDEEQDEMTTIQTTAKVVKSNDQVEKIVAGLGGKDNISSIINCYTRLRVDIKDETKLDMNILKNQVKSSGIVDKGKHIQIVIGLGVETIREEIENYLNS